MRTSNAYHHKSVTTVLTSNQCGFISNVIDTLGHCEDDTAGTRFSRHGNSPSAHQDARYRDAMVGSPGDRGRDIPWALQLVGEGTYSQ